MPGDREVALSLNTVSVTKICPVISKFKKTQVTPKYIAKVFKGIGLLQNAAVAKRN
jgi:hypothetical protein